jgi:predicted enzyme related to lactoylglutathione lyase
VATIGNITFAADEPVRLAEFWAAATWAMLVDPRGHGPRLLFQRRPRSRPQHIPIHLDLNAVDREREVERLVALGASVVETKTQSIGSFSETFTVMRDPEGNGFCVQ